MPPIRASEIGTYLFCKRAFWYRRQGIEPENRAELAGGSDFHRRHGRQAMLAVLLRAAAWMLLGAAVIVLAVTLTLKVLS